MPCAAIPGGLADFQNLLIGTWKNQPLPNGKRGLGGPKNPLSYNVMPLPQQKPGYILKNFTLYETMKFDDKTDVALPATAPNRGARTLQVPTALFYEQQVFFADGPGKDTVVHVENGAWLHMLTGEPLTGPYPPIVLDKASQQPPSITIAKQMSVPHGNSILALGSYTGPIPGAPAIPNSTSVLPTPCGLNTKPYSTKLSQPGNYQNPQPALTKNPNKTLQTAVALIKPTHYIMWHVWTGNMGSTLNIPFETRESKVTDYLATYWLLSTDKGKTYPYLAYTQNISLQFTIAGTAYNFPHVTTNVVTKTK